MFFRFGCLLSRSPRAHKLTQQRTFLKLLTNKTCTMVYDDYDEDSGSGEEVEEEVEEVESEEEVKPKKRRTKKWKVCGIIRLERCMK